MDAFRRSRPTTELGRLAGEDSEPEGTLNVSLFLACPDERGQKKTIWGGKRSASSTPRTTRLVRKRRTAWVRGSCAPLVGEGHHREHLRPPRHHRPRDRAQGAERGAELTPRNRSDRKPAICREYGGGGNRTRVRGRTGQSVYKLRLPLSFARRPVCSRPTSGLAILWCRTSGDWLSVGAEPVF